MRSIDRSTHPSPSPSPSNGLWLSGREWIVIGVLTLCGLAFAPRLSRLEDVEFAVDDYRIPYDLSEDYWLFERWAEHAVRKADVVTMGDSVIWGAYVRKDQTLASRLDGGSKVANLGLNGAHPAALAGLIEHHGGAIVNRGVLLQCNPLWMSSRRLDLREEKEFRFNHPELVAQLTESIPCYHATASERIGVVMGRALPALSWSRHLRLACFEARSFADWTIDHPAGNPFAALGEALPPADVAPREAPVAWDKRGLKRQSFSWVSPADSFQWSSFVNAARLLRDRGNRVFVLVGPLNEDLMRDESRIAYRRFLGAMKGSLVAENLPHLIAESLPSHLYGDVSHPLAEGYARLVASLRKAIGFDSFLSSRR